MVSKSDKNDVQLRVTVMLMAVVFMGKVSAFGKEVLISSIFGVSSLMDSYFIAGNVPVLINAAFLASIPLALIPVLSGIKCNAEKSRFMKSSLCIYGVLALLLTSMGLLFSGELVTLFAPFADDDVLSLAENLSKIFCISFVFSTLVAVFNSIQNSENMHIPLQVTPLINNAIVIIFIYFLSDIYGVYSLAVIAVIGWVIQSVIQYFLLPHGYFRFSPVCLKFEDLRRLWPLMFPVLIGVTVDQINTFVDTIIASGMGDGGVSSINYANRLVNFFGGIFVMVMVTILFPKFSRLAVKENYETLINLVWSGLKWLFLLCVPVSLCCFYYSFDIVQFIFERNAFKSDATINVSSIFLYYSIGLVFFALREILSRSFYALEKPGYPLLVNIFCVFFNVALSLYLSLFMGLAGLALATTLSMMLSCVLSFFLLWKFVGKIVFDLDLLFFLKLIFLGAGLLGSLVLFDSVFENSKYGFLISIFISIIVYFLLSLLLRVSEVVGIYFAFSKSFSRFFYR